MQLEIVKYFIWTETHYQSENETFLAMVFREQRSLQHSAGQLVVHGIKHIHMNLTIFFIDTSFTGQDFPVRDHHSRDP
uniref:Uncharacterized protein n=1 Tax=Steinernema glaseri TaxID=37863 RepID=A0A1I7ZDV1_9BILA